MNPKQIFSIMKSKDFVVCLHSLFSTSSLVGISLWTASNDVYSGTSSYNFYWVLCIFTFLFAWLSVLYYKFPSTWKYITSHMELNLTEDQKLYSMFGLSFVFTIMWLSASASVADITRECVHFKKYWETTLPDEDYPLYDRFSDGYYNLDYNYKCHGEIVSTTFGFLLFGTWGIVSYILSKAVYSKLHKPAIIDVANHSHSLQHI